ncbi:MAG: hypothetical protein ACK5G7_02675 [Erysipelotrichaceae bacterium]
MDKNKFEAVQSVAYRILQHSLDHNQLSHAYLFSGPKGANLKEYALFLAQSILCLNKDSGVACGKCDNCQRVSRGVYADIIEISGEDTSVKKEDIQQLIKRFNKTGMEVLGIKIYLIYNIENSSTEAMNSLLKFLEEPSNTNTYAILTTNQIDRVLSTIVSRSLIVPFRSYTTRELRTFLVDHDCDKVHEHLVVNSLKDLDVIKLRLEDKLYLQSVDIFQEVIKLLANNVDEALVYLQLYGLNNKGTDKIIFKYFIEIMLIFFRDLTSDLSGLDWYSEQLMEYKQVKWNYSKIIQVLIDVNDKLLRTPNILMLSEYLFFQIKEVK